MEGVGLSGPATANGFSDSDDESHGDGRVPQTVVINEHEGLGQTQTQARPVGPQGVRVRQNRGQFAVDSDGSSSEGEQIDLGLQSNSDDDNDQGLDDYI